MSSFALMLRRLERDALVVLALLAAAAVVVRPDDPRVALGVVGGGALMALSYLSIRDGVTASLGRVADRKARRRAQVKFFTRHAILALAAYGMMVRLHLDPLGMLVGVSSLFVAAAVEAVRSLRGAS
jgi:hypothetical protein